MFKLIGKTITWAIDSEDISVAIFVTITVILTALALIALPIWMFLEFLDSEMSGNIKRHTKYHAVMIEKVNHIYQNKKSHGEPVEAQYIARDSGGRYLFFDSPKHDLPVVLQENMCYEVFILVEERRLGQAKAHVSDAQVACCASLGFNQLIQHQTTECK